MAIISSGATSDTWTVDPTSKAGRVTIYNASGVEMFATPSGAFLAPVNIRQTAATAAPATVWSMRNPTSSTKVAYIRRIFVVMAFDGIAAASTARYDFMRFSAATPTGGTAITPIKKRNADAGTAVTDLRFVDTGLTVAGVTFETAFATVSLPLALTGGVQAFDMNFEKPGERYSTFDLVAGEGLAVQLNVTAVAGQSLVGFAEWDER